MLKSAKMSRLSPVTANKRVQCDNNRSRNSITPVTFRDGTILGRYSYGSIADVNGLKQKVAILNLPEPYDSDSPEETDLKKVKLILFGIEALSSVHNIKSVTRMGNFELHGKPRHIVVEFATEENQKLVLQNAYKMKYFPEWKGISIGPCPPFENKRRSESSAHQPNNDDQEKEALKLQLIEMQKQMALLKMEQEQQQKQHIATQRYSLLQNESHQNNEFMQPRLYATPPPQEPNFDPRTSLSEYESPSFGNARGSQQQEGFSAFMPFQPQPQMVVPNQIPYQPPQQQQYYVPQGVANSHTAPAQTFEGYNNKFEAECMKMMQGVVSQYNDAMTNLFKPKEEPESFETHRSAHPVKQHEMLSEPENVFEECEEEIDDPVEQSSKNELFNEQSKTHTGSKKTLNILVLGPTGVGKSTWINGIANYMTYGTIEEALKAPQPICLIPSKFLIVDANNKHVEVKIGASHGEEDENEVLTAQGQSATQEPKTYQFDTPKYIVNIIDTPGIGDTRGIEQDKENTNKILSAIGNYNDLHAICFLFKPNEARLTHAFRYCISELLLQLHKDAVDNIVFFFTNTRGTFYRPGDTMVPLKSFVDELHTKRGLRISLENENYCCTDNEAFRLVCAHFNGVKFTADELKNFAGSWKRSAIETQRFIEFAARQRPHQVADTVSINRARRIILFLAKPLADVNELIESNIKVFEDRKKDLQNTSTNLHDLKNKLKISQISLEVKPLNYPKTVCTAACCIETARLPNTEQNQTIYKQICHDHCYLHNVSVEVVPEPKLVNCAAMKGKENCQKCECHWSLHMHITFDQIKKTVDVEDENTKDLIKRNTDASVVKEKMIKDCEKTIIELKAEQQIIIQSSLRFGSFLQANAIIPYNDAFEQYVEQTICEEEKCIEVGGDRSKLNNLKKLLNEYKQEKALLTEAMKHPSSKGGSNINLKDIDKMKANLFGLKHMGKTLESLFKATEDGIAKNNAHVTVRYVPGQKYQVLRSQSQTHNYGITTYSSNSGGYSTRPSRPSISSKTTKKGPLGKLLKPWL